jgi:hypothetical protein
LTITTNRRPLAALVARFEVLLLEELGFGLDLSKCAGTGVQTGLIYVSPKSGCAVSADAGAPYKDKLLAPCRPFSPVRWMTSSPNQTADAFRADGVFSGAQCLGAACPAPARWSRCADPQDCCRSTVPGSSAVRDCHIALMQQALVGTA